MSSDAAISEFRHDRQPSEQIRVAEQQFLDELLRQHFSERNPRIRDQLWDWTKTTFSVDTDKIKKYLCWTTDQICWRTENFAKRILYESPRPTNTSRRSRGLTSAMWTSLHGESIALMSVADTNIHNLNYLMNGDQFPHILLGHL